MNTQRKETVSILELNGKKKTKERQDDKQIKIVGNFIDGELVPSFGKETVLVINPANKEIITKCSLGTQKDVEIAVSAAKEAYKSWRQTPVIDRVQILFKLKTLLENNFEELATLCVKENGKTIHEARGDVRRGIQMVETACGMPNLLMGKVLEDIASGIDCFAIKRPLGVFGGITPFNFPPMVPMWFWPFAIACGNTFVLKPSERVPLTQLKIAELTNLAGLPKGVLNIVQGSKEVVQALCKHPDIKGISFVGSTPVAKYVYETATSTGKRVQALGGAKNFMVVLKDATMDSTVKTIIESCCGCAGQRCLAGSVILVVEEIYLKFEKLLVEKVKKIKIGNGLDPSSEIGPLISEAAKERVISLIQGAINEGASILIDGRKDIDHLDGYFLKPTVITNVTKNMKIAKEEIFGPVICLAKVKTFDEAIEWLNNSNYANTASLFTTNGAAARKFSYEVEPSMIGINIGVPAPMAFFSFGGTKESFFGDIKAHGQASVDFYTDTKVTIQRWVKDSGIW